MLCCLVIYEVTILCALQLDHSQMKSPIFLVIVLIHVFSSLSRVANIRGISGALFFSSFAVKELKFFNLFVLH